MGGLSLKPTSFLMTSFGSRSITSSKVSSQAEATSIISLGSSLTQQD